MTRALIALVMLVLGAVALTRGLYIQAELTRQLETGTMGFIRSWIMWSTTDGRELVTWYRTVTPWLIWGGTGMLTVGVLLALWPGKETNKSNPPPSKPRRKER
jgi:hypothetical protein